MRAGYVFADGERYACDYECRDTIARDVYGTTWEDLVGEDDNRVLGGEFYYTEWHDEDECTCDGAGEGHPCPFKLEVQEDSVTMCTCCEHCTQRCIEEI